MSLSKKKTSIDYFDVKTENAKPAGAKFVILPVPYERTTSYLKGCRAGPEAIRMASAQVELFEPDVGINPSLRGIYSAPPVRFGNSAEKNELAKIGKNAAEYIEKGKFVAALGGEHTISAPLVAEFAKKYKDLSVLQIDAHPDMRDTYEGTSFNHASVGRRIIEIAPLVQVGVRSWCEDQQKYMDKMSRSKMRGRKALTVFPADKINGRKDWWKKVVDSLSDNVYLTLDLDGLDPAVIPAVGTPEPGGLGWYENLALMKELIRRKNLVGMDMVELKPVKGDIRGDFAAARLLYHIFAYVAAFGKKS